MTVTEGYKTKQAAWAIRRRQAAALRRKGKTWREIGEALAVNGVAISPQAARKLAGKEAK
jgi:hypothetical protein